MIQIAKDIDFKLNKNKLEKTIHSFWVEKIGIEQLPALRELAIATFQQAYETPENKQDLQQYTDEHFQIKVLAKELAHPDNRYFFLRQGGTLIGYAKLRDGRKPPELENYRAIELQRLYLLHAYWGQGGGSFLLQWLTARARSEGYAWMWLLVWFENQDAIRFYERHGFSLFSKAPFQFGREISMDWLMKTPLI